MVDALTHPSGSPNRGIAVMLQDMWLGLSIITKMLALPTRAVVIVATACGMTYDFGIHHSNSTRRSIIVELVPWYLVRESQLRLLICRG